MPPRLQVNLTLSLIQQIRLVHALAESAFDITVPAAEIDKLSILRQRFNLRLSASRPDDFDLTPFLTLVHEEPATAVGGLRRPLIFPRVLVDHCRTLWPAERPYRYSFAGLLTDQRRALLAGWLDRRGTPADGLDGAAGAGDLLRRQLLRWRGHEPPRRLGELTIWSSERGRRFPMKAWDRGYVQMLAQSAFVLCPGGDYRWSYRFFEAALCGAIPVVEEACPLYDGFRYRLMTDDGDAPWSDADALHNFRLCAERIVLPSVDLDRELARLLEAASAPVSAARARSARPPS
jgi:hypothetical protein